MSTPMSTTMALDLDENSKTIDQREYRSMIDFLLYLMVTRSDIQLVVCLCARFQASPRNSHRQAVQWIFRYLKYIFEFWIWYSASSSLDLLGFSDIDFAGCGIDKKAFLVYVTSLDLLLFVGLLTNNLLLHNPPQRSSL
jgi:hypothetical protein